MWAAYADIVITLHMCAIPTRGPPLLPALQNARAQDQLELYALYKQVTVGDCNTARPGFFAMTDRAKW